MATPHVSGTAALLLSIESDATPDEIETALTETARVPESYTTDGKTANGSNGELVDTRYGYGIVDASAAADALVAARGSLEPVTADDSNGDTDGTDPFSPRSSRVLLGGVVLVAIGLVAALTVASRRRNGDR